MLREFLNRLGFGRPDKPSQRQQAATGKQSPPERTQPFHAVSVCHGEGACAAVKAIEDKRFLTDAAPTLPLPDCDAAHCGCTYRHFADRREEPRRLSDTGVFHSGIAPVNDRREQRGRRKDDAKP